MFTITFIIGLQLPEFMQQYLQRASGHLNEAQHQLDQYSSIAEQHFDGNLATMLQQYKGNAEQSIVYTGSAIEQLMNRVNYLESHLINLEQVDYFTRLINFWIHIDLSIAQATLNHYQLAIPLELDAIITGALIAIIPLLIYTLLLNIIKMTAKKKANNC